MRALSGKAGSSSSRSGIRFEEERGARSEERGAGSVDLVIPSAARDLLPPPRVAGNADDRSRFLVAALLGMTWGEREARSYIRSDISDLGLTLYRVRRHSRRCRGEFLLFLRER